MRWDNAPNQAGGAWELCKAQHGVVARRQLLRLGLSERTIERRLASRRLHPVLLGGRQLRGVYAVGRPDVTQRGRWMAAVLACGEQAVLSHASAAALMGILNRERGCIELSVPRGHSARSPGIRVHRPTCLPSKDLGTFDGIPVTSPIKTLIDLATFLSVPKLEAAVNAADKHDLVDPETAPRRARSSGRDCAASALCATSSTATPSVSPDRSSSATSSPSSGAPGCRRPRRAYG